MNNNKVFWKLSSNNDIIIPGKYEDFKNYVELIKKVKRAVDSGTKLIKQTDDGGKTYYTLNILTKEVVDNQIPINFKKNR